MSDKKDFELNEQELDSVSGGTTFLLKNGTLYVNGSHQNQTIPNFVEVVKEHEKYNQDVFIKVD